MAEILKTFCGLHSCNVVASEYNNQLSCRCLGCPGCSCHNCEKYKELIQESWDLGQSKIERCINCQRAK